MLISFFATGVAVWLLLHVAWSEIGSSLRNYSAGSVCLAVLATVLSFCGLAAYDLIAVRHLRLSNISSLTALAAGAVSYGVTNFVGFPWLTGAMVRDVFYQKSGTGFGALMTVVMSSWIAFWLTAVAIFGVVLLIQPDLRNSTWLITHGASLGIGLVVVVAILLTWLSEGRTIAVANHSFDLLNRRVTLAQCGAALVDLSGSATVLYLFLPAQAASDLASFFGLFVMAVTAGILSHIPAGIEAFEATILLGLEGVDPSETTNALLMYRALRTLLPFVLASLVLVCVSLAKRRHSRHAS